MSREEKIDKIISNMGFGKAEKEKIAVAKKRIELFLINAENQSEENHLIELINSISWYNNNEIVEWVDSILKAKSTSNDIYLRFVKQYKQDELQSSSDMIIHSLVESGAIESAEVESVNSKKIEEAEEINCNNIFIIDDFIGTGNNIIENALKKLKTKKLNIKTIFIITFSSLQRGEEKIKSFIEKNFKGVNYEFITFKEEKRFDEKIGNREVINFLQEKSNIFPDKIRMGYKQCATSLAINTVSPNNNISLLWNTDDSEWIPLLHRNLNYVALESRYQRILKDKKRDIVQFYNLGITYKKITLKQFKLLVLIYNCSKITSYILSEFDICNTIEETEIILSDLVSKNIIEIKYSQLRIVDKNLLKQLYTLEKSLNSKNIVEKTNNFCKSP